MPGGTRHWRDGNRRREDGLGAGDKKISARNLTGQGPRNSLNSPSHALGASSILGLADFANAHLRATAAGHLKDVAIRRCHFKDAILITKNLGGIDYFNGPVDGFDHKAPPGLATLEALLSWKIADGTILRILYFRALTAKDLGCARVWS